MILLGADYRGATLYANYALRRPEEMQVVAVADPQPLRRESLAQAHNIPHKRRFAHWRELLAQPLLGDVAIICLPPASRLEASQAALAAGYHVLLDPPIAPSAHESLYLWQVAQHYGRELIINNALRYTAFFRALRDILASGRLGKIVSYKHERTLPFWQIGHRFLRDTTWRTEENPLLLLDGIHELDLMVWLLDEEIETLSSMGSERRFSLSNAPHEDLPSRCVEDCPIETECLFSAIGLYIEKRYRGLPQSGWPYSDLAHGDESPGALVAAVETERWGECVYHQDVSLIDHQDILMKSESGINVAVALNGNGTEESRKIHIDGNNGTLTAQFMGLDSYIRFYDHNTRKENTINFRIGATGHGGDAGLLSYIVRQLQAEPSASPQLTSNLSPHLLAFAAEEARRTQATLNFAEYRRYYLNGIQPSA